MQGGEVRWEGSNGLEKRQGISVSIWSIVCMQTPCSQWSKAFPLETSFPGGVSTWLNHIGSFKRTLYCEFTAISKIREYTDCSARRCGPGDGDMFVTDTNARVSFAQVAQYVEVRMRWPIILRRWLRRHMYLVRTLANLFSVVILRLDNPIRNSRAQEL